MAKAKKKTAKKKGKGSRPFTDIQKESFCVLYTTMSEFAGNGTQSYIEAFGIDIEKKGAYNVARNAASRLLTNANIIKRINYLIDAELNDLQVDKQLAFMVAQNGDLKVK